MAANYAVDGNTGTRWSSNFADDAWLTVDLGKTYAVNKVVLNWECAYGKWKFTESKFSFLNINFF